MSASACDGRLVASHLFCARPGAYRSVAYSVGLVQVSGQRLAMCVRAAATCLPSCPGIAREGRAGLERG